MSKRLVFRFLAGLLGVTFFFGSLIGGGLVAYGGEDYVGLPEEVTLQQPVAAVDNRTALEQAIATVKSLIQIPEECTEFSSGYSEDWQGKGFWQLNWETPGGVPQVGLNATVNAVTGEMWSFSLWRGGTESRRGWPQLSREQALEKAKDFLRIVIPTYAGRLQAQPDRTGISSVGFSNQPVIYDIGFERVENEVPFTEDTATVGLNGDTGEIQYYNLNWDEKAAFPSPQGAITAEAAADIWKANAGVELAYYSPYVGLGKEPPVKLVYAAKGRDLRVDAITGKPLPIRQTYLSGFNYMAAGGMGQSLRKSADMPQLTPSEEKALTEIEKLLTKEEALSKATAKVNIPPGCELNSAYLERRWPRPVWNFSWNDKEGKNYVSVGIDAGTGLVVSCVNWTYPQDSQGTPIKEEEALELAGSFARQMTGSLFSELQECQVLPQLDASYQPSSFTVEYVRRVNGLPFLNNGVRIAVDARSKKITEYQCQWWDLDFPSAQGAIGLAEAEKAFLKEGLYLGYERTPASEKETVQAVRDLPVRLIYRLNPVGSPYVVDAMSGEGLNSDLKPVALDNQSSFKDLNGNPSQVAVTALVEAAIIPVAGDNFYPDYPLTIRDFLTWLARTAGWRPDESSGPVSDLAPDQDGNLIQFCQGMSILRPGESPVLGQTVTAGEVARYGVRALGWGEVAELTGVWALPPYLSSQVAANQQGYLALASKVGLANLSDETFEPEAAVTKAEGAQALYNLLGFH